MTTQVCITPFRTLFTRSLKTSRNPTKPGLLWSTHFLNFSYWTHTLFSALFRRGDLWVSWLAFWFYMQFCEPFPCLPYHPVFFIKDSILVAGKDHSSVWIWLCGSFTNSHYIAQVRGMWHCGGITLLGLWTIWTSLLPSQFGCGFSYWQSKTQEIVAGFANAREKGGVLIPSCGFWGPVGCFWASGISGSVEKSNLGC